MLAASLLGSSACVSGGRDIDIDGSSTVFPITQAAAEDFSDEAGNMRITVGFSGTGGGFEKFCRGEIDIANASRPIRDAEVADCATEGIDDIVEIEVATDALTVVVNPANSFAECLTPEQLHDIFVEGGVERWSQIDPSWPDEPIVVYHPGADSGTFDYFVEAIIEGAAPEQAEGEAEPAHRSDGTASEDDNILVSGVAGDEFSIGYFGFAFFQEAGRNLKPVSIDDGEGCMKPTFENALSGAYTPLSRPLYVYTSASLIETRPEVSDFLLYYIDHAGALAEEVGYVALPGARLDEQREKILAHAAVDE